MTGLRAWPGTGSKSGTELSLADPMGLVTNLKLLDARGKALSDFEVAVHLNGLVHALPWQSEVQRALHHLDA